MKTQVYNGIKIGELDPNGPLLSSEQDALDVIGECYADDPDILAIPVSRFVPEFWHLCTRQLGLFTQKFVNYGRRLAFVGDLSPQIATSDALRDYVRECTGRSPVLFARDMEDLQRQLAA